MSEDSKTQDVNGRVERVESVLNFSDSTNCFLKCHCEKHNFLSGDVIFVQASRILFRKPFMQLKLR